MKLAIGSNTGTCLTLLRMSIRSLRLNIVCPKLSFYFFLLSFSSHSCRGIIVRTALQQYPDNVRTLLTVLVTQFIRLIRSPTFPRPTSSTFALPTLPLSPWSSTSPADDIRSVLNCARVIARVLPIIWEDESDTTCWLWEEKEEPETSLNDNDAQAQFVIEDEDEDDPDAEQIKVEVDEPTEKKTPSLMARFVSALIDSLFHLGFTLPADVAEGTFKTSYIIWYSIYYWKLPFNSPVIQGLWRRIFQFAFSRCTHPCIPIDSAVNFACGHVSSAVCNSH